MKKDYIKLLNLADEKYIEEADPGLSEDIVGRERAEVKKPRKRSNIIKYSAIAAAVALCVTAGGLGLFLPIGGSLPDVSMYSDSEYYSLIEKLNEYNYKPPKYKNNFEKILAAISGLGRGGSVDKDDAQGPASGGSGSADDEGVASPDGSGGSGGGQGESYEEVTDNQTEGVIEGDLIKRSDEYIYYLDGFVLKAFEIGGENSLIAGSYNVLDDWYDYMPYDTAEGDYSPGGVVNDGKYIYSLYAEELFLSEDCSTVTVILSGYNSTYNCYTGIVSLDVTDPEHITEKNRMAVTGRYSSSRSKDGELLLAVNYSMYAGGVDYSEPQSFVPMIDTGDGMKVLPADALQSPEKLSSFSYTVVMLCEENSLSLRGSAAYVSYSADFYASSERLYFVRGFDRETESGDMVRSTSMTEISCLNYGGGELVSEGSVIIEGTVDDRYSMDEYDGILRVFTTTSWAEYKKNEIYYSFGIPNANVSLYCIDISDWSIVASVENFAPYGESVQSARFDGDTAYVCTAIELSDPVFFFDLSDIENITYKHTGTIEGFSTSLIDFGEGFSVGIGVGSYGYLKIEAYVEDGDKVTPLCSYDAEAYYSEKYKSYYIDRENGLIGLGITDYSYEWGDEDRYVLLHFDGYEFTELVDVPLDGDNAVKRGVYIDGYFYMFGSGDFKVVKIA